MQIVCSKRRAIGFTLAELAVIIAILAVLIGMLLPALVPPRRKPSRIKCINNLKNVGLAFRIFAADHEEHFPMDVSTNEGGSMEYQNEKAALRHFLTMSNELSTPRTLVCPTDARRKPATNFLTLREANLSYFVGLNTRTFLTNAFLSGDRNLMTNGSPVKPGFLELTTNLVAGWTTEIHNLQGNVAMGDGSVQQFSTPRLAQALRGTGLTTNRLAVP